MDFYSLAPVAFLLDLAYTAVASLGALLDPLAGAASAALAVTLITLLVRLALIPVGISQVRAEFTRRRLAPALKELQRKYKGNAELLQRKTMELYAREKASPLAGCLPTLAQAPVVSILYSLFILTAVNGHPNLLLVEQFAGVPLGTSLVQLSAAGSLWPSAAVFLVLLGLIAAVAWMSRRAALHMQQADAAASTQPGLMTALGWLPFLTVVFAAVVPLAAVLYLTVSTTWTLAERAILRQRLGRAARP